MTIFINLATTVFIFSQQLNSLIVKRLTMMIHILTDQTGVFQSSLNSIGSI